MEPRYWFPAKTYGWGWGPPATWEGWLVLAVYIIAVIAVAVGFPPNRAPAAFFAGLVVLTALLLAICWLKGEPPGWRWGK